MASHPFRRCQFLQSWGRSAMLQRGGRISISYLLRDRCPTSNAYRAAVLSLLLSVCQLAGSQVAGTTPTVTEKTPDDALGRGCRSCPFAWSFSAISAKSSAPLCIKKLPQFYFSPSTTYKSDSTRKIEYAYAFWSALKRMSTTFCTPAGSAGAISFHGVRRPVARSTR